MIAGTLDRLSTISVAGTDWVAITSTRNWVINDPILDWLDLYGASKGFKLDTEDPFLKLLFDAAKLAGYAGKDHMKDKQTRLKQGFLVACLDQHMTIRGETAWAFWIQKYTAAIKWQPLHFEVPQEIREVASEMPPEGERGAPVTKEVDQRAFHRSLTPEG